MKRIVLFLAIFSLPFDAFGAEIVGPEVRLVNNEVSVTSGLVMDSKSIDGLKNGISKEITFYIDLFKVWRMWPNEFIAGKKLIRTLHCDPIKKEYTATSFDGTTLIRKRFRDFDSMLEWSLNVKDIKLINIKEIEPSDYFVRVTVESRLRKLPPVIGYLLFFVPEKEFKVTKDSPAFAIGGVR